MPEIETCRYCNKKIDVNAEDFVVVSKGTDRKPRQIAHPKCQEKAEEVIEG